MRLKSLEMQGFKSFPDRTKLEFTEGFTAVVGPNGCGKSNISDAIRWVLGEQSTKNLRGSKMEDVIFLGTQERNEQGFAQVEITLDNSDKTIKDQDSEIVISRKYYRDGESEYKLNGKTVLLKDISTMLMDTGLSKDGYSIIGQGKVEEIVSAKSQDRRQIFDECAGITKYRYRKKEAQKKLLLAEENLTRLYDILNELKERVNPLKKDVEKADKFLKYSDEKKELEISILANDIKKLKSNFKSNQDDLFLMNNKYKEVENELLTMNEKIKNDYERFQTFNLEIERVREEKSKFIENSAELKTKQALLEKEIEHIKMSNKTLKDEISSFDNSKEQLKEEVIKKENDIKDLNKKIEDLNTKRQEIVATLKDFNIKKGGVSIKCDELNEIINKNAIEKSKLSLNITGYQNRINELKEVNDNIDKKLSNEINENESLANEKENILNLLDSIENKNLELNNKKEGYNLKLKSKQDKLLTISNEIDKLEINLVSQTQKVNMLESYEKNMEGFSYSVKSIINQSKNGRLKGIKGTVSQLLKTDKKYITAIETSLGGAIQNIITEDEQSAKDSIEFLKANKAGRATFLPLTTIKKSHILNPPQNCAGFIDIAYNLIKFKPIYSNIFSSLLSRIVIVDNINNGSIMAKKNDYSFKIVTLDGQVINRGGSYTGGSQNKNTGLLSRQSEIDNLLDLIKRDKKIKEEKLIEKNSLTEEVNKTDAIIKTYDAQILVLKEDKIKYLAESKRLIELIEKTALSKDNLKDELTKNKDKQKQLEDDLLKAKNDLEKIEKITKDVNDELDSLEGTQNEIKDKRQSLEESIHNIDLDLIKLKETIGNLNHFILDLNERINGNFDKIKLKNETIAKNNCDIEKNIKLISEIDGEFENLSDKDKEFEDKINSLIMEKNNIEQNRELLIKDEKLKLEHKEKLGRELEKLNQKELSLSNLKEQIIKTLWDEYEISLNEALNEAKDLQDIESSKKQLNSIKLKIKNLGNVNLGAKEEYLKVKERFEFLNEQIKDAKKSKDDLNKLIYNLTSSMKKMFTQTFEEVNKNFKVIFKELFLGGSANLSLDDYDNVLECGIDIKVQPPGKIIKNLSALSGGEKSFVAIAIYFAILKVKPAPFCILDEIEAALDDVNVNKFAMYLKKIDKDTQFIAITHRRGTMERADTLYGVTMQEEGVSKLLKLPPKKIDKKNKILSGG